MNETNGLSKRRPRTCKCGVVFTAKTPQATYCSAACRQQYTRYGRSYGTVVPRQFGITKC